MFCTRSQEFFLKFVSDKCFNLRKKNIKILRKHAYSLVDMFIFQHPFLPCFVNYLKHAGCCYHTEKEDVIQ